MDTLYRAGQLYTCIRRGSAYTHEKEDVQFWLQVGHSAVSELVLLYIIHIVCSKWGGDNCS